MDALLSTGSDYLAESFDDYTMFGLFLGEGECGLSMHLAHVHGLFELDSEFSILFL